MTRRALAVFLLAWVAVMLAAVPASAHALVAASDPPDGALVQTPPRSLTITFTEPPEAGLSSIHVLDGSGRSFDAGLAGMVPGDPRSLRVPLKTLPNGVYTVTWRVVSHTDGHLTAGSFSFGVGVASLRGRPSVTAGTSTPSPPPLAVAGRWAFYLGLAAMFGAAVVSLVVAHDVPRGSRMFLAEAWVISAAGLIAMTLAERSLVGVPLGTLLTSAVGRDLVLRGLALAVTGVAVGTFVVWPRWTSLPPVGVGAAVAMLAHVLGGHATGDAHLRLLNEASQWLHLLSVGAWVGGLAWLLLLLRGTEGERRAAVVGRYSTMAGVALAVVAITGVQRALDEVGWLTTWRRLIDTSFGITLLVKVALFAGLVAFGAANRYIHVPGLSAGKPRAARTLRRTVTAELALGAAIFLATGILSELPTAAAVAASEANRPPPPQELTVAGSDFGTTVKVRLTVSPGVPGPNRFDARVTDYDSGRPVPATRVALRFALSDRPDIGTPTLELPRQRDGSWGGEGTGLSVDGRWSVTVAIQTATQGVEVPLTVRTLAARQRVTVTRTAGQPTLFTIALPGGASVQAYLDPGKPGTNEVHFTFFTRQGKELPMDSADVSGTPPGGSARALRVRRFGPGHFVADARLVRGTWRFIVHSTSSAGDTYSAWFDQTINRKEGSGR